MGVKCSLLPVTRPPRCGISTAIKRCRLPRSYWMHFGDSIWIRCVLRGVLYTCWFKRHGSDLYALKWHRSDQCNGSVNGWWVWGMPGTGLSQMRIKSACASHTCHCTCGLNAQTRYPHQQIGCIVGIQLELGPNPATNVLLSHSPPVLFNSTMAQSSRFTG